MTTNLQFQIGGTEHEFVRVDVVGSNGDGWLPSKISLSVGSFRGEFAADLDVWAFARFEKELRTLYESLKGTASFSTYEQQLELRLVGDGMGHVHVDGEAMDYAGTGNKLKFHLAIDQTAIPALLGDLAAISAVHPPVAA